MICDKAAVGLDKVCAVDRTHIDCRDVMTAMTVISEIGAGQ